VKLNVHEAGILQFVGEIKISIKKADLFSELVSSLIPECMFCFSPR